MAKTKNTPKASNRPMYDAVRALYAKNAPLLLVESVVFIIGALLLFLRPIQTLATLTMIFGIALGLLGIYQICVGLFGDQSQMTGRRWNLILGAIDILLGILFFVNPQASVMTIVFVLAVYFLIRSVMNFIVAIGLWRRQVGNYIINAIVSLVSVILAIIILFNPAFGAVTVMYLIAIVLLFYGFADIYMYVQLLKLKRTVS